MRRPSLAVLLLLPALTWAESFFELIERSADFDWPDTLVDDQGISLYRPRS